MPTFLFNDIIFGPVKSRRLGNSLGINLLPTFAKMCSFNCIYCECGLNKNLNFKTNDLPTREMIKNNLEYKMLNALQNNEHFDSITFAGNGEPTLHPSFEEIIVDTFELRNKYMPNTMLSVLTNASKLHKQNVHDALLKIDNVLLKLDSGIEKTYNIINNPQNNLFFSQIIDNIQKFQGKYSIQTMFLKGSVNEIYFDNSTEQEVETLCYQYQKFKAQKIFIYSLERDTPINTLEKIPNQKLYDIANYIRKYGFYVEAY